jgi:CubicO group peptidase (beta-lactamase class C family)
MARLGLLLLNDGQWNGQQLVASSWVREMTTLRVTAADANSGGLGYAYLWWKPDQMRTSAAWRNSYLALGNYGQNILVLPEVGTVIVHRRYVSDEFAIARNLGETPVDKTGISQDQFLNIADLAVAAML